MRSVWSGAAIAIFLAGCGLAPETDARASKSDVYETASGAETHPAARPYDAYLKAAVEHDHFSGAVLVAKDGVPVFTKSYGMANYELNVPNSIDTVFSVASITKQFTAAAILQLQEQGLLAVNDPICGYLDDCPATWRPVTIRHLLTHTSGIPNYSSLPDWDEVLVMRHYRHGELVSLFRDLPLQFNPGEKHRYSNSGYQLLGLIIERASGKPYGEYLNDNIFAPLGMIETKYDNTRSLIPNRATGYYSLGTSFINVSLQSPTVPFGDAGVHTTAADLLRWDEGLYGEKLLTQTSKIEMFAPVLDNYAYGWRVGERFGRKQANHSGSGIGFSSFIIRFPDEHVAVIVLSNSDSANATRIGIDLAAIYFNEPYEKPAASLHDILWEVVIQEGVESAIVRYRRLQRDKPEAYDFASDETLVELGYTLYEADRLAEAQQVFEFALKLFPKSAYSYDGLADIALLRGAKETAAQYFEMSLKLDPENDYAVRGLAKARS